MSPPELRVDVNRGGHDEEELEDVDAPSEVAAEAPSQKLERRLNHEGNRESNLQRVVNPEDDAGRKEGNESVSERISI